MPRQPRPPMPKLPPFALADIEPPRPKRPWYLAVFFLLFAVPLFIIHIPVLSLPYFWDEHGQFIPTALDILRHGWWVARSTLPNVHPPGVEAYLALWYKLFGYSIALTRFAMLLVAAAGVLITFLLSIELSKGTESAPAFWPPVLLLASPLFFTQSFMAQLDMPAMVFTLMALLLFVNRRYAWAVAACVALVLCKETGLVTPFVFFVLLLWRRAWRAAFYFAAPAIALAIWLFFLHRATGFWLGNPEFAHYNVDYSLHPVRMLLSFARRFYYLFVAEFRWIGTAALLLFGWRCAAFRSDAWKTTMVVAVGNIALVSVLGGAELERYLLPVLPLFYIAVAVAMTQATRVLATSAMAALIIGLIVSLFWNPPYPFPYENNYSMVDFVRLQQTAGEFADVKLGDMPIATAWPYTAALRNPDFGYVERKHKAVETNDFHFASIAKIPASKYGALIVYTRTWAPQDGVIALPWVRAFLMHFYDWQPEITPEECAQLGLRQSVSWSIHGQTISVYVRGEKVAPSPIASIGSVTPIPSAIAQKAGL